MLVEDLKCLPTGNQVKTMVLRKYLNGRSVATTAPDTERVTYVELQTISEDFDREFRER